MLQHWGGVADAFVCLANVLVAAAPMITAPSRARNPPLVTDRPGWTGVSLVRVIECLLIGPTQCLQHRQAQPPDRQRARDQSS